MSEIVSSVNPAVSRGKVADIKYPLIHIVGELHQTIPLVMDSLEKGDYLLTGTYKGETKSIFQMSLSALNISKLLRVASLEFVMSEEARYPVNSIKDYMEVMSKWI